MLGGGGGGGEGITLHKPAKKVTYKHPRSCRAFKGMGVRRGGGSMGSNDPPPPPPQNEVTRFNYLFITPLEFTLRGQHPPPLVESADGGQHPPPAR